LVEGDVDDSPARIVANSGVSFQGMIVLGMGFTFDGEAEAKGNATSLSEMRRLIARDPSNAERIISYLGGEEVNTSPTHAHHRWCIDFNDFPLRRERMVRSLGSHEIEVTWAAMDALHRAQCRTMGIVPADYPEPVAEDWPDLIEIVRRLVKPERDLQKRDALRNRWWQYADKRPGLRAASANLQRVIAINCGATPHMAFTFLETGTVWANSLALITIDETTTYGALQSRVHETWTRFFASSLKSDLRYGPSDCFETFPFPEVWRDEAALNTLTITYHEHRAALMVARNEGLTKVYNRFQDRAERSPDIIRMRDLHHELDRAVLHAYGWGDLKEAAAPEFLTDVSEADDRYQGRLFWPAAFREEVLARLLDLNRARAEEERHLGLSSRRTGADDDLDEAAE